ncbi:MAG: 37S ribosomal protein S23 mitochondrial [Icmadophila ericetorum]|nr:37S ribosomal protein S23 mitochondrial [Icmadophila ericetorum]
MIPAAPCWRCMARSPHPQSSILRIKGLSSNPQWAASFTTTPPFFRIAGVAKAAKPGTGSKKAPPKRGEKTTFRLTKKNKRDDSHKGKPPAPGERKALRRRIVLSNTNALDVPGMKEFGTETMNDLTVEGQVLTLPGTLVDQLRAVEAFKVGQGWGYFRRPSMLIRPETLTYGQMFNAINEAASPKTERRVIVGERGSGKSTLLLQITGMAFLSKWVVISIPDAMNVVDGHTDYAPLQGSSPTQYVQKTYTSDLLNAISKANKEVLSELQLSQEHPTFPTPLQSNMSLLRLAQLGAYDVEIAWPVFQALWSELNALSTEAHPRPPVLLTSDSLSYAMKDTVYRSSTYETIHAHDLTLLKWFMNHLSGAQKLHNGGMVIGAMSQSNCPKVPTLDITLTQLEAMQTQVLAPTSPETLLGKSPMAPFLRATGQLPSPIPPSDPFAKYDERVLQVLKGGPTPIKVHRLKGLSKDQAKPLMEYWAKSGLLRQTVSETLVGEKWSLAGGGIIGELERGCVRMRI